MADNYVLSSSFIATEKTRQARKIVERVCERLARESEWGVGFQVRVEANGVWIYSEESCSPENMAELVRELVEGLRLDGVYVCSWAYTCSKPRIDEFGGGAFAVQRGRRTRWVDAASVARDMLEGKIVTRRGK